MASRIKFEVVEDFGKIHQEEDKKTALYLTKVEWGDYKAKIDLRHWTTNFEKPGKGLTLTKDELISLKDFLNELDLDKL